jgi:hypothetical protein
VTSVRDFDRLDSLWDPGTMQRPGQMLTMRRHVDLLRVTAAACR